MLSFSRRLPQTLLSGKFGAKKVLNVGSQQSLRLPLSTPCRLLHTSSVSQQGAASRTHGVPLKNLSESFLDGTSAVYVEQMYEAWRKDPSSVHVSWAAFFKNAEEGLQPGNAFSPPPAPGTPFAPSGTALTSEQLQKIASDSMRLMLLVRSYQVRGHILAKLDPLGLTSHPRPEELKISTYGFSESDLDREFYLGGVGDLLSGFMSHKPRQTLREIITRLEEVYCGYLGVEYMHIQDRTKINWLREKLETPVQYSFNKEEKLTILDRLMWATKLEQFLATKWSTKRFGVDGGEALIPGLKSLIDRSTELGIKSIVMGMAHRGRLNVLANVVRKPLEAIFNEFKGTPVDKKKDIYTGSGDVKYHLGTSYERTYPDGRSVHLSLIANPSHLEAVDPLVEGKARARQYYMKDTERKQVMSVLLHGDASFAGQGIVYETVDFSGLANYTTGGTVHIIVNNQIGFTTDPMSSRGSIYCTDLAKAAGAPIFHVNGDNAEAVVHAFRLAAEWRQKFNKDVFIDLICYRKFGHNELDEPKFTQPLMYKAIDKKVNTLGIYVEQLLKEGVVTPDVVKEMEGRVHGILEHAYSAAPTYKPNKMDWVEKSNSEPPLPEVRPFTGLSKEIALNVGNVISKVPDGFNLHPTLKKMLQAKHKMFESGEGLDWGSCEALAFGSLLLEGIHVRLSGQDVERGTFSHRHAVLHDQQTGQKFVPLNHISPSQAEFVATNSSLSEFGVLGFELGYSLENRYKSLVLWEAQFGDFANTAQVIFDQFLSSQEAKWGNQSGLVVLLPHGYDGQGPEHSSARLERFLQLSDCDPDNVVMNEDPELTIQRHNMQVLNCTLPGNYFHALRRQIHRKFRKPMIVMTPKNLLKLRDSTSRLEEVIGDTKFRQVIGEVDRSLVANDKIRRVVFCSGKVYFDLAQARTDRKIKDVAIVRVEQLAPFPFKEVAEQSAMYPNAEIVWAQEEHKNMGAWSWISPFIRSALKPQRGAAFFPRYAGRPVGAATATGYSYEHNNQLQTLLAEALS